jgi:hypothetical protein
MRVERNSLEYKRHKMLEGRTCTNVSYPLYVYSRQSNLHAVAIESPVQEGELGLL